MASIIENQRSAFVSAAMRQARHLADQLQNVSPAEQAAILATVAAAAAVPVDLVLLGERGDEQQCAALLDGVLGRSCSHRTAWKLGSGCMFTLSILPGEEDPHE